MRWQKRGRGAWRLVHHGKQHVEPDDVGRQHRFDLNRPADAGLAAFCRKTDSGMIGGKDRGSLPCDRVERRPKLTQSCMGAAKLPFLDRLFQIARWLSFEESRDIRLM